ncbi:LysE family translocator [Desulfuromonas acetoxidans]|uniref:Threonine efflux protein n=1 Tax=Desulfuromonas acetoxidans (strain DSM 684 / 11070) TaxID=281689 RepID=Q1JZ10_DESA6|nr:LysE family translocator [Desulfuromonas acetoxidans]EAT15484.1 putative threonine efflux protein [Desulfuromonas acetoxidans DSM 684]MBF0646670.1 LysE family translocator [Desulfuromonas acetoxidans]NVD25773.1 LysE family translocator [Desulfuromonas acetoxidans]NVE17751.1 LysE family translocator [Desulfuromonas acetoxidans]
MTFDTFFLWLVTLLPIVISPGPANILFAASGSTFGVKGTVPFWLGANMTGMVQSLTVGFCIDYIVSVSPRILDGIKYAGVLFLLYLAVKFFKMSCRKGQILKPLTFKDGVIVELLNAKFLLVPTIMFSQFYTPGPGSTQRVVGLAVALLLLTLSTNMIWIVGGNSLATLVANERHQKAQGVLFGLLLTATAMWLGWQG